MCFWYQRGSLKILITMPLGVYGVDPVASGAPFSQKSEDYGAKIVKKSAASSLQKCTHCCSPTAYCRLEADAKTTFLLSSHAFQPAFPSWFSGASSCLPFSC